MYAEVLVEYGNKSLDKTFTYIVPSSLKLKKGMKVLVPFGNKTINGFVINLLNETTIDYELKSIVSIVSESLILNEEMLNLGNYIKEKTLCSLITAYQTMLPSSLKVKTNNKNYELFDSYIVLNNNMDYVDRYILDNKKNKKQVELLKLLKIKEKILKKDINCNSLKILLEKGLVNELKEKKYRINNNNLKFDVINKLTLEQQKVVDNIILNKEQIYLLHGVTGSGKTEVYLNLISKVIDGGKTAIMLVPEISLTTQIARRFYGIFGDKVAIFHSSLSEGEKHDEYQKILRKEVSVVVGTRSAIFTPLSNLGIIIIDEEHSENYKQDNNPRYHAIDMALFRSKYNNIPLVLGSATPTLESMARAKKGIYKLLTLPNRIGEAKLPIVKLIDMQPEMKKGNLIFSGELIDKVKEKLNLNEQVIILLNRRGYSTIITCQSCGYTYKCPHCDISLTYHKTSNNLRCHYCGYTIFKSDICPKCKEKSMNFLGCGTEKLELELQKKVSEAKIIRMDMDTTSNKGSHERIINDFSEGKYNILLGTQMISKGFDFPKVTLVGVINADQSLNIPDYKSHERTFELLSQVSGRAGRSTLKGEVLIQTFNPDNYALQCVRNNDYESFYNYEMNLRKKLSYPPYYYLCSVKIVSNSFDEAGSESKKVKEYLKQNLSEETIILGPTIANILKINNIYRFQIIIKYKKDERLYSSLKDLDKIYMTNKKVNLEFDFNPSKI